MRTTGLTEKVGAAALSIVVVCSISACKVQRQSEVVKPTVTISQDLHCYSDGPVRNSLTGIGAAASWANARPTGSNSYLYYLNQADRSYTTHRQQETFNYLNEALRTLNRDRSVTIDQRNAQQLAIARAFAEIGYRATAKRLWANIVSDHRYARDFESTRISRSRVNELFAAMLMEDQGEMQNVMPEVRESGALSLERRGMELAARGDIVTATTLLKHARRCGGPWVGPYPDYALGVLYLATARPTLAWPHLLDATTEITHGGDTPVVNSINMRAARVLYELPL